MNLKKTMAALVAGVMSVSAVATLAVSAQDELKAETALFTQQWEVEAKGTVVIPAGSTIQELVGTFGSMYTVKVVGASYVSTEVTQEEIKANNFVVDNDAHTIKLTPAGQILADKIVGDGSGEANSALVIDIEYSFQSDDVDGQNGADSKKNAAMKKTPRFANEWAEGIADTEAKGIEIVDLTAVDVNCDWVKAQNYVDTEGNDIGSMMNDGDTIKNWFEIEEIFAASKAGGLASEDAEAYWVEDETDERYKAVVNDINKNMRGYSDVTLTVLFSKDEEAEDVELKTNDYDNNGKDGADGKSSDLAIRLNRTKALIGYADFDKETMSCSFNLAEIMGVSNINNPVGLIDTLEFAFPKSSDIDGMKDNDTTAEYYWHSIVVSAPASDEELDQLDKDLAAGEAETTVEATLPAATDAAATTAADAAATTAAGAASTDAAANPSTGNSAVALAVIPVAIAAAAFVAKKRG